MSNVTHTYSVGSSDVFAAGVTVFPPHIRTYITHTEDARIQQCYVFEREGGRLAVRILSS